MSALEAALGPLDSVRQRTFRWALAWSPLRRVLVRRDSRVMLLATLGVLVSLALTITAPMLMLTLSPALLGIPHVASDVRYLVIRQRLPRVFIALLALACASLFALRLADELQMATVDFLTAEAGIAGLMITGGAIAGGIAGRSLLRAALVVVPAFVLAHVATIDPSMTRLLFAHLHNVAAIVLWIVLFRRNRTSALLPASMIVASLAFLFSGAAFVFTDDMGGTSAFGMYLSDASTYLAPGLPLSLGMGVALSYIFLQSLHYSVWLGWIPQEEIRGQATLSFRMSARSLVKDFRWYGIAIIVLGMAGVGAASYFIDVHATRDTYLSLAVFHGYIELTMLAYLLAAGRRRVTA